MEQIILELDYCEFRNEYENSIMNQATYSNAIANIFETHPNKYTEFTRIYYWQVINEKEYLFISQPMGGGIDSLKINIEFFKKISLFYNPANPAEYYFSNS